MSLTPQSLNLIILQRHARHKGRSSRDSGKQWMQCSTLETNFALTSTQGPSAMSLSSTYLETYPLQTPPFTRVTPCVAYIILHPHLHIRINQNLLTAIWLSYMHPSSLWLHVILLA